MCVSIIVTDIALTKNKINTKLLCGRLMLSTTTRMPNGDYRLITVFIIPFSLF